MHILIVSKSNLKLQVFGLFSRFVRTLIIKISSSEEPANSTSIHRVRNGGKLVILFHPSPKNITERCRSLSWKPAKACWKYQNGAECAKQIFLAHTQQNAPLFLCCYFWLDLSRWTERSSRGLLSSKIGSSLRSAKLRKIRSFKSDHFAMVAVTRCRRSFFFYLVLRSSLLLRFHTPAFLQSTCLLSADYSVELCSHRPTFHGLDLECRSRHIET